MNITNILIVAALAIAYIVFIAVRRELEKMRGNTEQNHEGKTDAGTAHEGESSNDQDSEYQLGQEYYEAEERYFELIKQGASAYKLAHLYSRTDSMLIKSILDSANIPFHEEFSFMAHVRPALPMVGVNNSELYIIDDYYDDALALLEEYISKKKEAVQPERKNKFRYVIEYVMGGTAIPAAKDTSVVIFRKHGLEKFDK